MIILLILLAASALVFDVDFLFYLRNCLCRYHIGRMPYEKWKGSVYNRAVKWSKHMPVVKKTDNARYMLLDILKGEYKDASIQNFQTGALLLGLEDLGEDGFIGQNIKEGKWKSLSKQPDCAMLAYALLRESTNPESIRTAMDRVYKILLDAMDENGLIAYTGNPNDPHRYVDALGMVCPFLMRYSRAYGVKEAAEAAYTQLEFYHKYGLLDGTALPNHAVNVKTKLPLGVYGWGRGTAWYFIALMDTYKEMEDTPERSQIKNWIEEAAYYYLAFQREDGGFGYILPMDSGFDSSVTSAMAWFYYECADLFDNITYQRSAEKALDKLRKVTRFNGAIDWSQGDTKGIGVFSQTFDIMPFTQGFALRAIALKEREKKC